MKFCNGVLETGEMMEGYVTLLEWTFIGALSQAILNSPFQLTE